MILTGPTETSTPSKGCCGVGEVALASAVAGREVTEAGIEVGMAEPTFMVFVGRGAGLVEGATDTDMSHAVATATNREMNKSGFFTILVYMAESPFVRDDTSQE
jgi:hypothetical protein